MALIWKASLFVLGKTQVQSPDRASPLGLSVCIRAVETQLQPQLTRESGVETARLHDVPTPGVGGQDASPQLPPLTPFSSFHIFFFNWCITVEHNNGIC